MEKNEALARVRGIERDIHRLTYDLKDTIVSAVLDGGATWPEIGNALGISKQTAHARYGLDVKIERDHRQWAIDNPERHAAAVARGVAAAAADLAQIEADVAAKRASKKADAAAPATITVDTPAEEAAAIITERHTTTAKVIAARDKTAAEIDEMLWKRSGHRLPGVVPLEAQEGIGTGAHACISCGKHNHKGVTPYFVYFNDACAPTRYDPQHIADFIKETNA